MYEIILIILLILLIGSWGFFFYQWDQGRNNNLSQERIVYIPQPGPTTPTTDLVITRDRQVMNDPLYPPLNRTDANSTLQFAAEPRLQAEQVRSSFDSFRQVGYLVNTQDKNDVWQLLAKEKHYRRGDADFYAISANKNMSLKVQITNDMIISGGPLRDLYSLPNQLVIRHAMFAQSPYEVIELPRSLD